MNRRVALPFLTLSPDAISGTAWQVSVDECAWVEALDSLDDWDAASTIRLRRSIRLEPVAAAASLAIPVEQLRLAVSVRIGTGPARLPRRIVARYRHLLEGEAWQHDFDLQVSGRQLSTGLELLTEVTLALPPAEPGDLSPRASADRLWSDVRRLRLEGEEPRFPIERADFASLLGESVAASAPWHLHWSPRDWDRDFHGAVRLYLNEKATDFIERLESNDGRASQVLLADIMGQICERLVRDPDAEETFAAPQAGSLGAQAVAWLNKAWPGKDVAFIRSVLEDRPGVFRSALLALAELPGD